MKRLLPILLFLFVPMVALALTLTLGTTANIYWNADASYNKVAQSFLAVAGDYTAVTISKGAKAGTGFEHAGSIQADSSGDPSGTDLATFTAPASDESGDYTYALDATETLSAATYWVVLTVSANESNYSPVGAHNPEDTYADGHAEIKLSAGGWGTWVPDFVMSLTYTTGGGATPPPSTDAMWFRMLLLAPKEEKFMV